MSWRPQIMYKSIFLCLLLLLAESSASASQQHLRRDDRQLLQQQEHRRVQEGVEPASGFLSFTLDEPFSDPSPPEPTTLAPTSLAPAITRVPVAPSIPGEPTVTAQRDTSLPPLETQQEANPPSTTPTLSPSRSNTITTALPTMPSSSVKPSSIMTLAATTEAPTTRAPTVSPTIKSTSESPSVVTTTIKPTTRELPTVAPTTTTTATTTTTSEDIPTHFPSTVEPLASDEPDTTILTPNTTVTPTAVFSSFSSSSPQPTQPTEQQSLVAQVQDMLSKAVIMTQCSIWSAQLDIDNLQERVLRSLHTLFCDDQPHDVCFLQQRQYDLQIMMADHHNPQPASENTDIDNNNHNDNHVATTTTTTTTSVRPETRRILSEQSSTTAATSSTTTPTTSLDYMNNANNWNATVLYISVDDVTVAHANVDNNNGESDDTSGGTLSWSVWNVSWLVVRLGQHVIKENLDTVTDAAEVYDASVEFVHTWLLKDLNAKILDGTMDHVLNIVTNGGGLAVSSITGQEQNTFAPFVTPTIAIVPDNNDNDIDNYTSGQHQDDNDSDKNKSTMYIVLFFAGLLVGLLMVVFLLCATCRPQRMAELALEKPPREPESDEATSARESSSSPDVVIDTIYIMQGGGGGRDNNSVCAVITADINEQQGAEEEDKGEHCQLRTQNSFGSTGSALSRVDSDVWSVSGIDLKWSV